MTGGIRAEQVVLAALVGLAAVFVLYAYDLFRFLLRLKHSRLTPGFGSAAQ